MKKLTGIFTILLLITSLAAETLESSPWVGWRKGYEYYDKAAECKEKNQFENALKHYTRSREYFHAIRTNFPQWNKSVVEGRIRLCDNEIKSLQKLVRPARRQIQTPPPQPQVPTQYPPAQQYPIPANPPVNYPANSGNYNYNMPSAGASSGRLYIEMQSEIDQYRQKLRTALMEIDNLQLKLRQSEARTRDVDGILRDYRLLQEKYSLLEVQYKNAMERSVTGDRNRYENQIMTLKLANDEALKRTRQLEESIRQKDNEYALSRNEVLKLRADLQTSLNEAKRFKRELELRSNQTSAVQSAGGDAADKIKSLESELKRKDQRIDRLMRLLSDNPADQNAVTDKFAAEEIKRLRSELETLRKNNQTEPELRRKASELTGKVSTLTKQLADLDALLKVRENELKIARDTIQKNNAAKQVTNTEMRTLSKRTEVLEQELKTYANRYRELEKRHQDRINADAVSTEQRTKERNLARKNLLEAEKKMRLLNDELHKLKAELEAGKIVVQNSRTLVIDLKAKQHSTEIELRKMAELQKAYDELKAKFDLFNQASNSDVLKALNRIPGLEESLKRYEKENNTLLNEIANLKRQLRRKSGTPAVNSDETNELERIETLLADARSAVARGNQEIAIWGFRQVLLREPDNQEAAVQLGNLYLTAGKFDEAYKLLDKARKNTPDDEKIVNSCAKALLGKRNYNTALKLLRDLRKARKGRVSAELLLTEAVAYSRSGKNADAEKCFRALLKQQPNNAEAAYELALMLSADEKRRKEAGEFYMLAKNNGIAVDSYLEEILRSFSTGDHATRNFLLNNAADAMQNDDMSSAAWYLSEVKKLYPTDKEYKIMQAVYYIMNKQSLEIFKLFGKTADNREKLLCSIALILNEKYSDAEKMLQATTKTQAGELPEALKKFIQKEMSASAVNSSRHKLCETVIQKFR